MCSCMRIVMECEGGLCAEIEWCVLHSYTYNTEKAAAHCIAAFL